MRTRTSATRNKRDLARRGSGPKRVCVFLDPRGWHVEGCGTEIAARRFATRGDAEHCALDHQAAHPDDGEVVVHDAYRRVVAVFPPGAPER
jgi:hypothetical protein